MRAKAASRYGDIHKQNAEISRLQVELDKRMAAILALRTREEVHKGVVRRVLKILLYYYIRARRRRRPPLFEPVHGDIQKRNAEIGRLQVELDKRMALIFALRTREEVRKGVVRRVLKIVLYFYIRARRRRRPPLFEPVQGLSLRHVQQAERSELAAAAAAVAALNLKRRRAALIKL